MKRRRQPQLESITASDVPEVQSARVVRTGTRHQARIIEEAPIKTGDAPSSLHFHPPEANMADVEEFVQALLAQLPQEPLAQQSEPTVAEEEHAAYAELGVDPEDIPAMSHKPQRSGRV
ncbi:hypothetical protein FRC11_004959, partial [Ceratobasidium sp. 423]